MSTLTAQTSRTAVSPQNAPVPATRQGPTSKETHR
jgi:hypothetical protein